MTATTKKHRTAEDQLETALDHLRAYKTRQDDIVLGLSQVLRLLDGGFLDSALSAVRDILATDLKQAKKRVYDREVALKIAIDELKWHTEPSPRCDTGDADGVLDRIEKLVPDLFGKDEEMEASA